METSQLHLTEKEQSVRFLHFVNGTDSKDGISDSQAMEGVEMTSPRTEPEVEDISWLNHISEDLDEINFQPDPELLPEPLTEFHIFDNLPVELRLKIFEHALPENYKDHRILTITGIIPTAKSLLIEPSKRVSLSQAHHGTTISIVNHESRDVWLRAYRSKITLRGNSLLRFNPQNTLFYIPNFALTSDQFNAFSQSGYWSRQSSWMSTVQILAVDTFDTLVSLGTASSKWDKTPPYMHFENLKKIVLLVNAGRLVSRGYQGRLGVRKMLEEQRKIQSIADNSFWKNFTRKQKLEMQMESILKAVRNMMGEVVRTRASGPVGEVGSRERKAWEAEPEERIPEVVMMDSMRHDSIPGAGVTAADL